MDLLRRISRLVVLGLVVTSLLVGGVAVAAQAASTPPGQAKKAAAAASTTTSTTGPGNSGAIKPGKGCGDKNHYHERENECKKTPK